MFPTLLMIKCLHIVLNTKTNVQNKWKNAIKMYIMKKVMGQYINYYLLLFFSNIFMTSSDAWFVVFEVYAWILRK